MLEGDGLIAEVRADLSYQSGVQRDGDGVRSAGEHLPLDGGNLGIKAATNLEEVDLGVALGADGVGAVGVGVKAGDIFAAVAKGTNQLKGAPARLARLEEQGLDLADGCADAAVVVDDGVVGVLGKRVHEVVSALDIASPLMPASLIESLAIGFGNIELAVGVLGEALLLGHGLDGLGVEAVLGVVEVDIVVEAPDIRVERRDVISELHGNPLMPGKCGEQPGLVAVGDDNLVVGADALLVNQTADKLDALTGRGAFAQDNAGVAVLTQAIRQGVHGFDICIHAGA